MPGSATRTVGSGDKSDRRARNEAMDSADKLNLVTCSVDMRLRSENVGHGGMEYLRTLREPDPAPLSCFLNPEMNSRRQ